MADKQLRVVSVMGTRPEAIKMAPVALELMKRPEIDHKLVVTGQHRTMLDQMLPLFGLKPDMDLNIMSARQTLTQISMRALEGMERALAELKPDVVLVHGDTSTSFISALAAYYAQIPAGHVEAGLRTGDKYNPFPEEMNRLIIDSICEMLFAPTESARNQLISENKKNGIYVTGNTVIDALLSVARMEEPPGLTPGVPPDADVILVEAHRRENWGEPMRNICLGLRDIVESHPNAHIVFPVHLNPVVRDTVNEILGGAPRTHLMEPQDYLPFVFLMKRAKIIITDSGGVQEEGPSLGKPVLVLRLKTERPEAVDAGTARVIGPFREKILEHASLLLDDEAEYNRMASAVNPYGDGRAAGRIADALLYHFNLRNEPPEQFIA